METTDKYADIRKILDEEAKATNTTDTTDTPDTSKYADIRKILDEEAKGNKFIDTLDKVSKGVSYPFSDPLVHEVGKEIQTLAGEGLGFAKDLVTDPKGTLGKIHKDAIQFGAELGGATGGAVLADQVWKHGGKVVQKLPYPIAKGVGKVQSMVAKKYPNLVKDISNVLTKAKPAGIIVGGIAGDQAGGNISSAIMTGEPRSMGENILSVGTALVPATLVKMGAGAKAVSDKIVKTKTPPTPQPNPKSVDEQLGMFDNFVDKRRKYKPSLDDASPLEKVIHSATEQIGDIPPVKLIDTKTLSIEEQVLTERAINDINNEISQSNTLLKNVMDQQIEQAKPVTKSNTLRQKVSDAFRLIKDPEGAMASSNVNKEIAQANKNIEAQWRDYTQNVSKNKKMIDDYWDTKTQENVSSIPLGGKTIPLQPAPQIPDVDIKSSNVNNLVNQTMLGIGGFASAKKDTSHSGTGFRDTQVSDMRVLPKMYISPMQALMGSITSKRAEYNARNKWYDSDAGKEYLHKVYEDNKMYLPSDYNEAIDKIKSIENNTDKVQKIIQTLGNTASAGVLQGVVAGGNAGLGIGGGLVAKQAGGVTDNVYKALQGTEDIDWRQGTDLEALIPEGNTLVDAIFPVNKRPDIKALDSYTKYSGSTERVVKNKEVLKEIEVKDFKKDIDALIYNNLKGELSYDDLDNIVRQRIETVNDKMGKLGITEAEFSDNLLQWFKDRYGKILIDDKTAKGQNVQ